MANPALSDPARYVLADDAPYLKNLAALWTVDPALATAVETLHPETSYPVQLSKSGAPTVSLCNRVGADVLLHSRYRPAEEGAKLAEASQPTKSVFFYCYGFGLGYHIESLFDAASDEAIFCVLEPDLRLLRTALESRDLARLIESRRFIFLTRLDKGELMVKLTPHSAMVGVGVGELVHPASLEVAPEFHQQMRLWIEEFSSFSRTSLNTVVLNSRRTAENISRNLGWYAAVPGLGRLQNRHRGEPAIIVSAGPSLRKNKHLLAGLRDKAVLIAVQTTLQPMVEMGVEPHYATSLDYHEICTRFYEKLPKTLRTELVAEPKANSAIMRMYPGPVSLLGNSFAESVLRELKLNKPELTGGATVAHLAFYLAEHLGCDPIIFVGQDLGFTDGLYYSPGTSYEDVWRPELSRFCTVEMKQWEQIVRERFILRRIPDQQGAPMYTEERLFTYLQQFERDFLRSKSRVIDATEGGAAKRGTTVMTLADAASKYCTKPLQQVSDDYPQQDWQRIDECIKSLERRRTEAEKIEQISRETLPLLEEIRDHVEDQQRVNRAIAELDTLRAKMNAYGQTYDLVTELTQGSQMDRFTADRRIQAEKVQGIEKQRRQVSRDLENVRGVMNAAGDLAKLMVEVKELLEAERGGNDSEDRRVKNATAILSMLHEPAGARCSAIRRFRTKSVLAWTLDRLTKCRLLSGIAVLCWDDQQMAVVDAINGRAVIRSRPRTVVPEIESVAAAQRWADGWRGGLLATCNFDLGFYGPWHHDLANELHSDAVILVDPSAALVDPDLIDRLVLHANSDESLEYAFAPAAPGLMGFLIRPTLLNRLAAAKAHPGRLMHYHPDQASREPIAAPNCLNIPAPLARTVHRFTLDSDRQVARISAATEPLNGQLVHSAAEELVRRSHATPHFGVLPREIVLELNTTRATKPIFWPGQTEGTERDDIEMGTITSLCSELATVEGTRITLGGVGDPLLHPRAFEIIDALRAGGKTTINIETDLLDLTVVQLEQLATSKIDVLSVNLPALSQQTYTAVMSRDGISTVVDNIRKLLALRNKHGVTPIVTAVFTKCRANLAEMEPWYDQWIRALGAAVVRGPSHFGGKIPDVSVGDMSPPGRRPCARLASRITILSNGTIVPCEQDVTGQKPLGRIGQHRLVDVWKGGMNSLRARHVAGDFSDEPLCAGCREWHRP